MTVRSSPTPNVHRGERRYHVKNKNKYIVKNCASRWSFTKNHNMIPGQQNVKVCWLQVSEQEVGLFWKSKTVLFYYGGVLVIRTYPYVTHVASLDILIYFKPKMYLNCILIFFHVSQ